MPTLTNQLWKKKIDKDGNIVLDESGNEIMELVKTETIEAPPREKTLQEKIDELEARLDSL